MKPFSLSLRWQVIVLATLVLALMAWAFAWQQYKALTNQFVNARLEAQKQHVDQAGQVFKDLLQKLQNQAGILENVSTIKHAMAVKNSRQLAAAFEPFWAEFNLGTSLEYAVFFDDEAKPLSSWGEYNDLGALRRLAQQAVQTEKLAKYLSCTGLCLYSIAVPVVNKGHFLGTIVLGSGLSELILRLQTLSGSPIAVLSPSPARPGKPYLPAFHAYLASVSGKTVSDRQKYSEMLSLTRYERRENGEFQYSTPTNNYRIHPFPIPVKGSTAQLAVIEDVTAEVAAIRAARVHNLIWGGGVLLAAVLLLYGLLWPVMQRIRRVAQVLPLLGEGQYPEVRGAFQVSHRRFRDETDELGDAAIHLADTLEHFNTLNRQHTEEIAERANELRRERDFITGLLDTAPALIVTHAPDGPIRLANAHAVQACGMDSQSLHHHGFLNVFFGPDQHDEVRTILSKITEGEVYHTEGRFERPDGSEREVVWFHSLFEAEDGAPTCLSVGLDITAHKQAERRLSLLVDHDAVTGLYNRRAFKRELGDLMEGNRTTGALLVCDIDEFKAVNEASGHETGDALLSLFARSVSTHDPLPRLAARLSGDEFAFFYKDLGVAEAIVAARQINQSLVGVGPNLGLPKRSFTSCVGIALIQEGVDSSDALIANAETALSQAQGKGEGNWHLFSPTDPYQADKGRRVFWSDELERALAEKRLVLHFQPILNLATRRISHWEALIRMRSTDGKLIMPGQFMGVAEATGLVRHLDRWVIGEAGRVLGQPMSGRDIHLSVNLSGRSLDDDETFDALRHSIENNKLEGNRFILEITETAALSDIKSAARLMFRFREMGCVFSLDDFGVGYTSFQYLKELPVDFVKIDGSFIVGLKRNRDDQVFVKALTEAVHGFGKQVVAEFVEDGETLDILNEYGVDFAQGYYIGRPASKLTWPLAA